MSCSDTKELEVLYTNTKPIQVFKAGLDVNQTNMNKGFPEQAEETEGFLIEEKTKVQRTCRVHRGVCLAKYFRDSGFTAKIHRTHRGFLNQCSAFLC